MLGLISIGRQALDVVQGNDDNSERAGLLPALLKLRAARWCGRCRQWVTGNQ